MMEFKLSFSAVTVTEKEVAISKEITLDFNEYSELVTRATVKGNNEIQLDKIDENDSDEINEMLFACLPPSITDKCVSISYKDIRLQQITAE